MSSSKIDFYIVDATDFEELRLGLPKINYEDLEKATDAWSESNVIGRGGFGIVFKGKVKQTLMAIKRLERQVCAIYWLFITQQLYTHYVQR